MHLSHGQSHREWQTGYKFSSIPVNKNVCKGLLLYTRQTELLTKNYGGKLDRSQCWTKYKEGNGTGLDIHWEEMMIALPHRHCSGHHKATWEESDQWILGKFIWRTKYGQQDLSTAGGRWRRLVVTPKRHTVSRKKRCLTETATSPWSWREQHHQPQVYGRKWLEEQNSGKPETGVVVHAAGTLSARHLLPTVCLLGATRNADCAVQLIDGFSVLNVLRVGNLQVFGSDMPTVSFLSYIVTWLSDLNFRTDITGIIPIKLCCSRVNHISNSRPS